MFKKIIKRVLEKHFGIDSIEALKSLEEEVREEAIDNDEITTEDIEAVIRLTFSETLNEVAKILEDMAEKLRLKANFIKYIDEIEKIKQGKLEAISGKEAIDNFFRDLLKLESIAQKSKLTKKQAKELDKKIKKKAMKRLRK